MLRAALWVLFLAGLNAQVSVEEIPDHAGQPSLKISTPTATWIYHKEGAGLASLLDRDGRDWITYRPGGRSAGEFRGIPNLGPVFHPGYTGDKGAETTVLESGPARVRIRSATRDQKWMGEWEFLPTHARFTLHRAGEPFWFLYEGTPGGKLNLNSGYWVMSDGIRRPLSEAWHGLMPNPEWVYFADPASNRVLFLVNHQNDRKHSQYWPMDGNMTVWGFAREYRCCGRYFTEVPAAFTVGLTDSTDPGVIDGVIRSRAGAAQ